MAEKLGHGSLGITKEKEKRGGSEPEPDSNKRMDRARKRQEKTGYVRVNLWLIDMYG